MCLTLFGACSFPLSLSFQDLMYPEPLQSTFRCVADKLFLSVITFVLRLEPLLRVIDHSALALSSGGKAATSSSDSIVSGFSEKLPCNLVRRHFFPRSFSLHTLADDCLIGEKALYRSENILHFQQKTFCARIRPYPTSLTLFLHCRRTDT